MFINIAGDYSDPRNTESNWENRLSLLDFIAPEILGIIFDQFYSSPKRKGRTDPVFLDKLCGLFIWLTAAILLHSLQCWQS